MRRNTLGCRRHAELDCLYDFSPNIFNRHQGRIVAGGRGADQPTLTRKVKGQYVLIENVPAGICTKCGTRYFSANVLKTVEESVHGRRRADREIVIPVYAL